MNSSNNENTNSNPLEKNIFLKGREKMALIIFLVDISNPYQDEEYFKKVNEALLKLLFIHNQFQEERKDIEHRIAIMTFADTPHWICPPTALKDFKFNEIAAEKTSKAHFSNVFTELYNKLNTREYMAYDGKITNPSIFMLSNAVGEKNDDYSESLNKLFDNGWFMYSERFFVILAEPSNYYHNLTLISKFVSKRDESILYSSSLKDFVYRPSRMSDFNTVDILFNNQTVSHNSDPSYSFSQNSYGSSFTWDDISFDDDDFI